jgi:hypothetical protein
MRWFVMLRLSTVCSNSLILSHLTYSWSDSIKSPASGIALVSEPGFVSEGGGESARSRVRVGQWVFAVRAGKVYVFYWFFCARVTDTSLKILGFRWYAVFVYSSCTMSEVGGVGGLHLASDTFYPLSRDWGGRAVWFMRLALKLVI